MKFKTVAVSIVLATIANVAFADSPAIKERQAVFDGWGKATKPIGGALRGQGAFDLAATQAALKSYAEGSKKLQTLFPDDSKTGDKTAALPVIWEDKAKFLAGFTKMEADATAAVAAIKDEASFKTEMPKVLANCGTCHKAYKKAD